MTQENAIDFARRIGAATARATSQETTQRCPTASQVKEAGLPFGLRTAIGAGLGTAAGAYLPHMTNTQHIVSPEVSAVAGLLAGGGVGGYLDTSAVVKGSKKEKEKLRKARHKKQLSKQESRNLAYLESEHSGV